MQLKQHVLGKHQHTSKKRGGVSGTRIALYASAFVLFVSVIAVGYQKPQAAQLNQVAPLAATPAAQPQPKDTPSVDEALATSVAADFTEQVRLPIASNVANESVSMTVKSTLAQTDDTVTSKPQLLHSSESRSIQQHTIKRGDTVASVAKHYGISTETLRWANDLTSNNAKLQAGKSLKILPVDGVVYTAKSGDTAEKIARTYNTSAARIITFNDLELSKPKRGQLLIIPDGKLPASQRPGYVEPTTPVWQSGGSSATNISANNFRSGSVGNKYAFGYCTWYAYERRAAAGKPIGSFWGNAYSWASAAASQGYTVNNTPAAGAVFQTSGGGGGYGHVAYVERVDSKGNVYIREMNYAGWNVVSSRTISAGQARSYSYIH